MEYKRINNKIKIKTNMYKINNYHQKKRKILGIKLKKKKNFLKININNTTKTKISRNILGLISNNNNNNYYLKINKSTNSLFKNKNYSF